MNSLDQPKKGRSDRKEGKPKEKKKGKNNKSEEQTKEAAYAKKSLIDSMRIALETQCLIPSSVKTTLDMFKRYKMTHVVNPKIVMTNYEPFIEYASRSVSSTNNTQWVTLEGGRPDLTRLTPCVSWVTLTSVGKQLILGGQVTLQLRQDRTKQQVKCRVGLLAKPTELVTDVNQLDVTSFGIAQRHGPS